MPTREQVDAALAGVEDPEIRRPITELGMVKDVRIAGSGDEVMVSAGLPYMTHLPEPSEHRKSFLAGVVSAVWMQPVMALTFGLLDLLLSPLAALVH